MIRAELLDLINGPIATVPTPMHDDFSIEYETMERLTEWWIESGLTKGTTVIKVAAAMGEGPDLSDEEWAELLRTVVKAGSDRAAIVCGLKPKDTVHTFEDAKRARELGGVGLQIGVPFFHRPTLVAAGVRRRVRLANTSEQNL